MGLLISSSMFYLFPNILSSYHLLYVISYYATNPASFLSVIYHDILSFHLFFELFLVWFVF